MENIEDETFCCNLFSFTPLTKKQIEKTFDDNDNEILIINKSGKNNKFSEMPINFLSNSKLYNNNLLTIRKISSDSKIRVSGSLENHYAPKAKVFLDEHPVADSGFIALESIDTPDGVIRLAAPKTVEEFARVLYSALREGDHQDLDSIYIAQPAGDGLAVAIRDRLSRSARGR